MVQLFTLLTIQSSAAIVSFIAAVVVVAVVVFLMATSSIQEDKASAKHKVYKLRERYFSVLAASVIVVLLISLQTLPYKSFQGRPDETITVVGMQWAWKMATGVSDQSPRDMQGSSEITVPARRLIKFIVTSADVNHNFAIYDPKGDLVAQTQAMPHYKNELEHVFYGKGDYHILCLEYCGMPHSVMTGTIHVN